MTTTDVTPRVDVPFLRAEFPPGMGALLEEVMRSGYVGAGPRVDAFEKELAAYLGVPEVVCTSSCTGALTLVYADAGIGPGSVVLTTPVTCAATNVPLLHLGARIRWLDVDPLTGNVTPDAVRQALEAEPEARMAVIMDWAGLPCEYQEIERLCAARGCALVVDAAQSFGSTYGGQRFALGAGTACYSFGPTKILSSVEGGAVATRDSALAARLRKARWYGIDRNSRDPLRFWNYDIERPGHRFTMNDVFAAVGRTMLPRLDDRVRHHREIAALYRAGLQGVPGLVLPPDDAHPHSNYWMFTVVAESRDGLLARLHGAGIQAAVPHNRNDEMACFHSHRPRESLPGVDHFASRYLCLPIGPWVGARECERACAVIRSGW
jgi:dTDP-4-amino-4,6-dideoxygalactose transaminase